MSALPLPAHSLLATVQRTATRPTLLLRTSRLHPKRAPVSCFSTTSPAPEELNAHQRQPPRWAQTPKAMAMPVRVRRSPKQAPFLVNEDSKVLDDAYAKFLGKDGAQVLPEEIKWLAVTHKSFDHGRRGNYDRLAYLGKRIVDLQCSLALLDAPQMHDVAPSHSALKGLENVTSFAKQETLGKQRIAELAQRYDLGKVVRWKPRKPDNLRTSGYDTVLAETVYSIIGAIALQKGGDAANRTVQDRILTPLGLR